MNNPKVGKSPLLKESDTPKPKSEKELKKERLKAEKLAKFQTKQEKQQSTLAGTDESKAKVKKAKKPTATDSYDPAEIEEGRYEWWEQRDYFKPEFTKNGQVKEEGKFVIPIPPPNVTGSLHMGHALTNALQDTMIRHNRMRGKTTLWIPGCDHASISTQNVVEKRLWKTKKQTRHDVGRDGLLEMIWDWTNTYKSTITNQLRVLGGSMDWTREAFTMDQNLSDAVRATFIQLHEEGTIYRANRLINWCPILRTSISNLEVEYLDLNGRTQLNVPGYERKISFGILTYFKYPISKSSDDFLSLPKDFTDYDTIEVATTRLETMPGDVAIGVHPDDSRYQRLIGQSAVHPFIAGRRLRIIADAEVDPALGTGVVKLTPAHSAVDFTFAIRHGLEFVNIFTDDGLLNDNAGPFSGQRRYEARNSIAEALQKLNLFSKDEDHAMQLPICERSKDVIQPMLKPQWWMKMSEMAQAADAAVTRGEINIQPESEKKRFHHWMHNIQDWCLSRQLWWGHRPPAYLICIEGETIDDGDNNNWVCANDENEARRKAEARFPGKSFTLRWDEDVLDTWFSSGLWPWAILGWPKNTHDFETLYPTSVLETGWDILFPWVARMIMLGLKLTGQVPFAEVYCHSSIRDSEGRKMSKSLGNVVDPLDIISGISLEALHEKLLVGNLDSKELEKAKRYQKSMFPKGIPQCGTDALRFALVNYTTGGGDIAFDIREIESKRRFCNKIYQATNFAIGKFDPDFVPDATLLDSKPQNRAEVWILHRLNEAALRTNKAFDERDFSVATNVIYQYWMAALCDTFIENSKSLLHVDKSQKERSSTLQTLYTALEGGLLLLHPVMPYITEHLWQKLPRRENDTTDSIMIARYPEFNGALQAELTIREYELVIQVAEGIRSLLSGFNFKDKGELLIQTKTDTVNEILSHELSSIKALGGKYVGAVEIKRSSGIDDLSIKGYAAKHINTETTVFLKIVGKVDIDTELARQEASLLESETRLRQIEEHIRTSDLDKAGKHAKSRELDKFRDIKVEVDTKVATLAELKALSIRE